MPTDHAHVSFTDVWVPDSAILGARGPRARGSVQHFVQREPHPPGRLSAGRRAVYCIDESGGVRQGQRKPFGKPLASNQAIQWPLVELHTQCEMLRAADPQDRLGDGPDAAPRGGEAISDKVSMCNYWANRLCCEAADRAMQVHGGIGYSRHKPFEHIYRHHRRYRITEGSEEIQMRRVAGFLFGYIKRDTLKGVTG